ncbi:MAG: hypothetical protein C5B51_19840 [Terriglobia bacterium]|nr:MAG: hypothetical protein C5B51_19840 [Terriglobia bacterium]
MSQQEKINREFEKHPWCHPTFFNRPHWTRRRFFEVIGAGITGAFLAERYAKAADVTSAGMVTKNTAQNVVFILLAGAPSHTDTFDLKMVKGVTPDSFAPQTMNGVLWPTGLLPNLGNQLSDFAIVRSVRAHALVHSLAQTWTQIGRNPAAALGNIAPNIGSVVSIEKENSRLPGQIFPTFLALNSGAGVGGGYLPAVYAPFKVAPNAGGIANTTNPDGQARFGNRWNLLHTLDDNLRVNSPNGKSMGDYNDFYSSAQELMYNPAVRQAFSFTSTDSARYGNTTLGNSCLVALQVLKANQGTRFIQITSNDGWDMHQNIYAANQLPAKGKILDTAVSNLLADLKANGLLSQTLVVMVGEFGRTVGMLSAAQGRDHYPQQFAMFAGGGVVGGRVIGSTNDSGSDVADFGWSAGRYIYPEDIEATIYSAMGIDWTTVRHDDPLGRGFEYVPSTGSFPFLPVNELFG